MWRWVVGIGVLALVPATARPQATPPATMCAPPPGGCLISVPAPPPTPVELRREANRWLIDHFPSWSHAKRRRLACGDNVCHAGWTSYGKRRHRTLLMQGRSVLRVTR